MSGFVVKLGEKLAERWVSLLVLPGALFVGVLAIAATLGQPNALDAALLVRKVQVWSTSLANQSAAVILGLVGVLLAAAGAGLVAQTLGLMVERLWLIEWPRRLMAPFVGLRRRRGEKAHDKFTDAQAAEGETAEDFDHRRGLLAAARNRIALAMPTHPTWMGDRIAAAATRVHNEYGLDAHAAWPRLWLVISEETRSTVRAARVAFTDAAALVGWSLMYLAVGVAMWWPAVVVSVVLLVVGHRKGRQAAATYADLVESVFDVHSTDLAEALRIPTGDSLTPPVGHVISERLRKGT
ncbi:hypothetical protein [Kibdelosporangium aridum]|uniref:hypothetical protein n=1 Tax=Kibdelosporangium aridum TaxID=2030 RepID=UPI000524AC68